MDFDDFILDSFWVDFTSYVGAIFIYGFFRKKRSLKEIKEEKKYLRMNLIVGNMVVIPIFIIGLIFGYRWLY